MTGSDDDDDRTQFIAQPGPPRPSPPVPDEDDDRTQFISTPGGGAALAGGSTGGAPLPPRPAPDDDDRTQFAPAPAAPPPGGGTVPPAGDGGAEEFYHPEILGEQTDQPTSTGAFPQAESPTFVAAPPAAAQPTSGPVTADGQTATPIGVGTIINNNYRIEQVLKSGGMGSVFRGVNIHTDDPVAIKVILPELAEDEKVGLMFKREARTLGQLQDDAIVRYYNYVYDPDLGGYCLVMEFISGVPLSDHTNAHGPISVDEGKILLRRLAKGLQKAHDQEVVHRDLSPDNVMLPEGSVSEAVLIDFGIAKSNVVKEGTMAGQFAGKFKYVAPEQLGHFGGEIGPRADIYSLALLMAAATVGKPVDMGSSIVEAVQTRQSIPDLSEVPQDLRPILMHMLEPDPGHRPVSMSEIVELMDQPERIPLKYRDGLPLPNTAMPSSGTTTRTFAPISQTVQGLQAPPSAMHVGGTLQGGDLPIAEKGGSGLVLPLVLSLVLAGTAAAVYLTVGEDIMAGLGGETAPDEPDGPEEGLAPRAENTREGFLAEYEAGDCTYATRITAGADAGMIAGVAQSPATAFTGLPAAYEEQFGTRPAVAEREVTDQQCAALDFARALQGTILEPVELQLDTATVETGQVISGRISDQDERRIWLGLVSPQGGVFNLTPRVSAPVAGVRTFSFGLNLAAGADAAPQLLVAIATEEPLTRLAASRDGAVASGLFPLILREIETKGGTAVATLAQVMLTPPAPEEPPAEEAGEEGEAPAEGSE